MIYDNGVRALHVTLPQTRIIFIFFVYIFIHNLANKSPFGLKFSQMILNTETSNLMYNWSFLLGVLHKPTLLPSTFKSKLIIHKQLSFIVVEQGLFAAYRFCC